MVRSGISKALPKVSTSLAGSGRPATSTSSMELRDDKDVDDGECVGVSDGDAHRELAEESAVCNDADVIVLENILLRGIGSDDIVARVHQAIKWLKGLHNNRVGQVEVKVRQWNEGMWAPAQVAAVRKLFREGSKQLVPGRT